MEARGSLRRPFWDSSPLMTPIFITWTIPGHFYLVRAVPGAVPTAAASMDGSDGRTDGLPGTGKGLKKIFFENLLVSIERPASLLVSFSAQITIVSMVGSPITDMEGVAEHRLGTRQHP